MNRQIKFRIWNKREKVMISNGSTCYCKDGNKTYYIDNCENLYDESTHVILEFTGCRDWRNNSEIYEGDIVKIEGQNYKVIWSGCGFYLNGLDKPLNNYKTKVVGNIFENPELLQKNI